MIQVLTTSTTLPTSWAIYGIEEIEQLTIDNAPTENSNGFLTSGNIYNTLQAKLTPEDFIEITNNNIIRSTLGDTKTVVSETKSILYSNSNMTPSASTSDGNTVYTQSLSDVTISGTEQDLQLKIDNNIFDLEYAQNIAPVTTYDIEDPLTEITSTVTSLGYSTNNNIYQLAGKYQADQIDLRQILPFNFTIILNNGNSIPTVLDRNLSMKNYFKASFIEAGMSETDAENQADSMSFCLSYNCSNTGELISKIICQMQGLPAGQSVFGENYNTFNFNRINSNEPAISGIINWEADEDTQIVYFSFMLWSDDNTIFTGYEDGTYTTAQAPDLLNLNNLSAYTYNIDEEPQLFYNKLMSQHFNIIRKDTDNPYYIILTSSNSTSFFSNENFTNAEIFYYPILTEYIKLPIEALPTTTMISDDDTLIPTSRAVRWALQNIDITAALAPIKPLIASATAVSDDNGSVVTLTGATIAEICNAAAAKRSVWCDYEVIPGINVRMALSGYSYTDDNNCMVSFGAENTDTLEIQTRVILCQRISGTDDCKIYRLTQQLPT